MIETPRQMEFFSSVVQPISTPAPVVPYIRQSETSKAAAAAIGGASRTLRQAVLNFIRSRREHGACDFEIAEALVMSANTARPRRIELRNAGVIVDSGRTRLTRSGRVAVVWVVESIFQEF
jgi:hypothetical protein